MPTIQSTSRENPRIPAALRVPGGGNFGLKGGQSHIVLDLVDATALLWRLHLRGVPVGERWASLADGWNAVGGGGYAFNDWHATMAYVGAGRDGALKLLLDSVEQAALGADDNAMFTRDVGLPLMHATKAFGSGEPSKAASLIRPVWAIAHRFGGSHAQRDLIDLTLIEAAIRAGDAALASALAAERAAVRPHSPATLDLLRHAAVLPRNLA
jgi:hypothetical protein